MCTSSETEYEMECGLFLNVVVRQGPAIFQLFTSKDQPLLVGGNPLLVLDLGLHILDGVRWLHLQSDGFTRQRLYKDLHTCNV